MRNFIIKTQKETLSAGDFYYNEEGHYINYCIEPVYTKWQHIRNVVLRSIEPKGNCIILILDPYTKE